jgi:hypothetical protein
MGRNPIRALFNLNRSNFDKGRSELNFIDNAPPPKAEAHDFPGRFREIISDPLNAKIVRHPWAGLTKGDDVVLHNGAIVPFRGPHAYYGDFSEIFILNRGVHEPLEEYCFQEVLKVLPEEPAMIEMGAYWGHYSMWCQIRRPNSRLFLVEPDKENLEVAKYNLKRNGMNATFINAFVGKGQFEVDHFMQENALSQISILHSDIQGFELEMLQGAKKTLADKRVDYCFISTHSDELHQHCQELLTSYSYDVEISSNCSTDTTSYDGFIFARNKSAKAAFKRFVPLGREQIAMRTL